MTHKEIQVEGMTCGHCVETVTRAVNSINGISKVSVDLEAKQVAVDYDESQTDLKSIFSKITEAGYEVINN